MYFLYAHCLLNVPKPAVRGVCWNENFMKGFHPKIDLAYYCQVMIVIGGVCIFIPSLSSFFHNSHRIMRGVMK